MTDLAATIDAAWEDRANVSIATTGAVREWPSRLRAAGRSISG
jgi:hypothetical protein